MEYYYTKTVTAIFEDVVHRTVEMLKEDGFGVLSDIDVKATFQKKLGIDFYNYRILGACNPPFAYQALQADDKIGTLLPCNVILQERIPGSVEISAIDPTKAMQQSDNLMIMKIASEVGEKLKRVIGKID
jgi:uncharacterized protein (DUF302 family)